MELRDVVVPAAAAESAASAVLRLQAAALSQARLDRSAAAAATQAAAVLACQRVAIGLRSRQVSRVLAISHQAEAPDDGQPRRALSRLLSAAMDEAIDQAATLVHPLPPGGQPRLVWAHEALAREQPGHPASVCTVPMVDDGRLVGAIVFERAHHGFTADDLALCEQIALLLGPLLELQRRQQRGLPRHALDALQVQRLRLLGPGHAGTKAVALGTALLLLAAGIAALVEVPYRISGSARIEGAVQRVLVAPVDGYIEQVNVRPGDAVQPGQVLAELARDELQLERRRWQSQAQQQGQAYAEALARHDRAQLVLALSRGEEARAQLELAEQSLRRTRLEAPFAGVVIQGDLSASLGSPVKRGDVLMTLAQGEGHRVVLEVDERDIADLRAGQPARLVLAASPARPLGLTVRRVTPVAAVVDGRNVFEVEAAIHGAAPPLRPGLRGVAHVDAGRQPLLWLATHRVVDWLRLQWWAWAG